MDTSTVRCSECADAITGDDPFIELGPGAVAHLMCPNPEGAPPSASPARAALLSAASGHERSAPLAAPRPLAELSTTPVAIEVFTDGACRGNPGRGGWAWVAADGRQANGAAPNTTNQRMEIQAALEAAIANPGPLVIVSDSTYVVNCFRNGWWHKWIRTGWTSSSRKPVANRDLWEPLVDLVQERGDVSFRWVKGHSGSRLNELADRLAVQASRSL